MLLIYSILITIGIIMGLLGIMLMYIGLIIGEEKIVYIGLGVASISAIITIIFILINP